MLESKGLPIPLRKWAQAGGYDLEEALGGTKGDIDLRKRLAAYKKQIEAIDGPQEDEDGGGSRYSSAIITEAVAELPVWDQMGEFLTLRRGEVSRMADYMESLHVNGRKPGVRDWSRIEARMKDDGISYTKIRSFRYLVTRAGFIDAPLPNKTVVKVRDEILRKLNGRTPDRHAMREIYWLNHELDKREIEDPREVVSRAVPNVSAAPWVRPAGPRLLTGEGFEEG